MRYLDFSPPGDPSEPRLGAILNEQVLDIPCAWEWAARRLNNAAIPAPRSLQELVTGGDDLWQMAAEIVRQAAGESPREPIPTGLAPVYYPLDQVCVFAPIRKPPSIRDFYAFEEHVRTANQIRGREIPEEWYDFPVFYFSNPNAVYGPGQSIPYPSRARALDYELEIACVIRRPGINIRAEEAMEYVAGFTILNDWSARDIQRRETRVGLGPAKAKDFALSLGPWLVTPDELSDRQAGRPGVYDLTMAARVNQVERSRGNLKSIHYSFGELIARASEDAVLMPGDILGSGTVGGGCLLELTGGEGPWLEPGDTVELEVERLGVLRNTVGNPRRQQDFNHQERFLCHFIIAWGRSPTNGTRSSASRMEACTGKK